MVGTKKAKETEKKAMMKMKKAASKSHGSRPTVLLAFCGASLAHSQPQRPTLHCARCRNTGGGPATVPCGEGSSRITIVHQIFDSIQYSAENDVTPAVLCCVLYAVCYP
jgi:hypothetical protein